MPPIENEKFPDIMGNSLSTKDETLQFLETLRH